MDGPYRWGGERGKSNRTARRTLRFSMGRPIKKGLPRPQEGDSLL